MIVLNTTNDINLLVFYLFFFSVLISGFVIASLIRSNINHVQRNKELSDSLYECNENLYTFNNIKEKLKSYERDIEDCRKKNE